MNISYKKIWDRITQETDIKTQNQLAAAVGVKQSSVSARKSKNEFSAEWAFKIGQKYGISTDWIMTGEGDKQTGQIPSTQNKTIQDLDKWLTEITAKDQRKKYWFEITLEEAFPEYKKWKNLKRKEQDNKFTKVA